LPARLPDPELVRELEELAEKPLSAALQLPDKQERYAALEAAQQASLAARGTGGARPAAYRGTLAGTV